MGLFGLGKPKKKMRGPGKAGTEKLAGEKAKEQRLYNKWLASLQDRGDSRFDELMMQRHGMTPDTRDPVAGLVKTLKMLRDADLIDDPKSAGKGEQFAEALKQLGPLVAAFVPGAGGQNVPATPQAPPGYVYALVPAQQAQLQPTTHPVQQLETEQSKQIPPTEKLGDVPVSPLSQKLIDRFSSGTAEQAAGALLNTPAPFVEHFVALICTTPDVQIDMLLVQLSGEVPELAGAFHWMRQRPPWLHDFVVSVRKAKGSPLVVAPMQGNTA